MTDTMLEKAARALKEELGKALTAKPLLGDASSGDWYSDSNSGSIDCVDLVRAVLSAIREPDEMILLAICVKANEEQARPVALRRTDATTCWQAGIDAILAEKPK